MYKGIKTMIQVVAIWSPVLYWNFNVDTATTAQIVNAFVLGGIVALLAELAYRFVKYLKS